MAQWFYARDGQSHGPVSAEELREQCVKGDLSEDDLVWREQFPQWVRLRTVRAQIESAVPPPLPPPALPIPKLPAVEPCLKSAMKLPVAQASVGNEAHLPPTAQFASLDAEVPKVTGAPAATPPPEQTLHQSRGFLLGLGLASLAFLFISWLDYRVGPERFAVNAFTALTTGYAFGVFLLPGVVIATALLGDLKESPTRLALTLALAALVLQGPEVLLLCWDFRDASVLLTQQHLIDEGADPEVVATQVEADLGKGLWLYLLAGLAGVGYCLACLCRSRQAHLAQHPTQLNQVAAWTILVGTLAYATVIFVPTLLGVTVAGLAFLAYGLHQLYAPQAWCLQTGRTSTSLALNLWGVLFYFLGATLTLEVVNVLLS